MNPLAFLAFVPLLLASPVTGAATSSAHAAKSRLAPLYTASFGRTQLTGWSVALGDAWHVNRNGAATFNGSGRSMLLAPFSTQGMHDFAVQASIKVAGRPHGGSPYTGFGAAVRVQGASGVSGGAFFSPDDANFNRPLLAWEGDSVGGAPVLLHRGFNTYRVAVHGADFTLSIDGQRIVRFMIADFGGVNADTGVGLWSIGEPVQVRSFTVTRLRPAATLPAAPPVAAVNLVASDVPATLSNVSGVYHTNREVADLDNVPLGKVRSSGLLLSYQANFTAPAVPGSGPYGLFSDVYAYKSAGMAETALAGDMSTIGRRLSGPTFESGQLSGLGDEAYQVSTAYTESDPAVSIPYTVVGIFFRRGSYGVSLGEYFVSSTLTRLELIDQATALARIIDGRIQRQTASSA